MRHAAYPETAKTVGLRRLVSIHSAGAEHSTGARSPAGRVDATHRIETRGTPAITPFFRDRWSQAHASV